MWPRKHQPYQEPVVLKASHFRTPRMLRDCKFENTGTSFKRAFDKPDHIVMGGSVIALVLLAIVIAAEYLK